LTQELNNNNFFFILYLIYILKKFVYFGRASASVASASLTARTEEALACTEAKRRLKQKEPMKRRSHP
jgi:hypothetical protein